MAIGLMLMALFLTLPSLQLQSDKFKPAKRSHFLLAILAVLSSASTQPESVARVPREAERCSRYSPNLARLFALQEAVKTHSLAGKTPVRQPRAIFPRSYSVWAFV